MHTSRHPESDAMNEEMKRLLAEGKTARARQLAEEAAGGSKRRRVPGSVIALLFSVVLIVVTVGVIYGMTFLGLAALEGLRPLLDRVTAPLLPLLLSPVALGVFGLAVLLVGLPSAP